MKTQQRNVILTLSALTLATAFVGLGWLLLDREPGPDDSSADLARAADEPQGLTTQLTGGELRQAREHGTADEAVHGLFSAAPGTLLAFELVNKGSSTISNHEGAVQQSFDVDLNGELNVEVLARRDDELAFAIRLSRSQIEQRVAGELQAGEASLAIAESLARPVIVRAKADGTTLGFRFDAQARPDERNRMRTLWGALMPVVPEPLSATWTAQQEDVLGAMRCDYRLVDAQAARVEIERTARECLVNDPTRPTPKLTGTARIGIERGLGWFDSVVAEEFSTIEVDVAGWTILSQQRTRCTLTSVRHDGRVGVDWDTAWESASGAADAALVAQLNREQQLRSALEGRTLEQLVERLNALLAAGDPAAAELVRLRDEIGFLLSINAEALAQVAQLVLDPRVAPEVVAALIDCVGRAGTPEAQALLAQWIADGDKEKDFRTESVYALIELKQPGDNVVAAVAGLLGGEVDPQLQGSALLTMGALANIGGAHSSSGSAAYQHVMDWKASAEDSGRLPEWIEALGNTGSPQVVAAVKPYLVHENDAVRASAVHALRLVFTLEVSELASACGRLDESPNVRGRAAEVLGARVDSAARAAIAQMLESESVELIRQTLIMYLGSQAASDPAARALLEDAAATDPSAELRELAQQQLSAVQHG